MKTVVRALLVALALVLPGAVAPGVAFASCLQQSPAELIANAEVIAVGVVTETRQTFVAASGVIRFRADRVLKGALSASEVQVYLGPTHGGAPTSVDYTAVVRAETHTLYLRATSDGSYETNACAGSHPGSPTPDESNVFGPGTLVAAANDTTRSAITAAVVTIIVLALVAIVLGVRRVRRV